MSDDIDRLATARNEARAAGRHAEADRLTRQLNAKYDQKRRKLASKEFGSTAEIVKRARIEVELSRIMSADPRKTSD